MSWLALIATTVISLCVLVAVPATSRVFIAIDRLLAAIARRQAIAMAVIIVLAIALAGIPTLIWSPPVPYVTDEFSYLLAADTLAHGRLSNLTPPMPEHFEYPNVLVRPTYASKYPLGQGAALALGQVLFRLPIVGAWLTSALACVVIAWALRAVVPPKWALIGGLLAAMHPLVEWWHNCYWGGHVAMLGGALLFGAILRAMQGARFRDGVIAGLGAGVLLHSRPIEGAITTLITFAGVAWYARFKDVISRFLPGFIIALVPAFALLALHDYRVTGNALLHPHVLHQRQYMVGTPFFWERPNFEQTFNSPAMRSYAWDHDYDEQRQQLGVANYSHFFFFKGASLLMQYVEPITLLIAVAVVPWRRVRAARIAAAVCIAVPLIQLLISPWMRPAYMAPVLAPLVLLFVLGIRRLSNMNRWGRVIAQTILITAVATYFLYLEPRKVTAHQPAAVGRQQVIEDLRKRGGRHLVIVRYGRDQVPVFDLVANGADFAEEPVIFAREINPNDNRKLSECFPDRTAWLLEVQPQIRMTPLNTPAN